MVCRAFTGGTTLLLITLLAGCATGPPKPASLIRQAKKASKMGDDATVLRRFETVIDTTPYVLNRKRYADEIELYRNSQIAYGFERARAAESAGQLIDAWVWYYQTSLVDDERAECQEAAGEAERLRLAIAADYSVQAERCLDRGDSWGAMLLSAQSIWYGGGEPAAQVFCSAAHPFGPGAHCSHMGCVRCSDIAGFVRTDSLQLLQDDPVFAPYGIPIYFGDVPRYYASLGSIKKQGVPITQKVPPAYAKLDVLFRLSRIAMKRGADALINVHIWTKSKKSYTEGEMVRFLNLPDTAE